MRFERRSQANLKQNQYNRVFLHFYIAFILIALIHMSEIFIWTMLIQRFNLIADPIDTIIFVGSCYTTVGFASDILPQGWKSVAFFISFSGLFTLAWTTAMMIGMIACYKEAWTRKYAASS
ncbi:hypothetical protein TUM22923_09540 [Polynucleobacter sp. TUM22923]|jgi:hypothetical protein|nr:hypothetical protein TUM22923_09540 [Polynucleobacter sp. TUM22923]